MKNVLIMPVLTAALFAVACGDDGGPTTVDTRASVRFFNATTGMTGSGAFTTNGQFASGSALAFGQSMQTCSRVNAGSTSFGFGAANTGGTGLSGNALATLANQSVTDGGNYTVIATGSAPSPTLYMLNNNFAGTLGTNQAAVRFVNLAPATETNPNTIAVFIGTFGAGGTLHANNIAVGAPTTFTTVASGSNAFTVLRNHEVTLTGGPATLNLQGGSVNTLAIVQNSSGGLQLINLPRCS
jgi:hypothetical protein